MTNTRLTLLLAACATAVLGCADDTRTDSGTSPATGTTAGGTGGSSSGASTGMTGTNGASGTNGSTGTSGSTVTGTTGTSAGDDDASIAPPPGDCEDDESTFGNDCPGVVTCTAAVDYCSFATQNCCVTAYAEDGASCNEGSVCDGLTKAACDGPEDCPDTQQCCISVSAGFGGAEIKHRCVADATECTGGLIVDRIMCHSDDDCGSNEACEAIPNLPWWGQCK